MLIDGYGRAWDVLERDNSSVCVYYTRVGESVHYVVYDTMDNNDLAELRVQLAAADARAERFRAALEDIAWQNLYPTMADIARAALKGERKEQ